MGLADSGRLIDSKEASVDPPRTSSIGTPNSSASCPALNRASIRSNPCWEPSKTVSFQGELSLGGPSHYAPIVNLLNEVADLE